MTWLRSAVFALLAILALAGFALAGLPLVAVHRRRAGAVARGFAGCVLGLLRAVCGLKVEVRGLERLPATPVLIASKHQSAFETLLFTCLLPGAAFVLKREIVGLPVVGWYVAGLEPIAVDRGAGASALRGMVRQAREAVAKGRHVVIFPEGTRTAPGRCVAYHPGVAALYAELGIPVLPVALDTGRFWGRRSFLKRPGAATVAFLEAIPPGLERRRFMALLQERIESASEALSKGRQAA
jgi:1-acyl-sn-glycerol-3-phosphate acyltransferase